MNRPLIPVEAEPGEALENGGDQLRLRAVNVGVLNAQDEDAAMAPREQPVVERRARATDVEVPRRRWREANADVGHLH